MYVIGLDIGTTCTKALLTDEKGQVASVGTSGYPLISNGCKIEQDPNEWIKASILAIKKAVENIDIAKIGGLSLSTQGASTVAVDEKGEFIGNSVTWMDSRAVVEANEVEKELGGEYIYHTSGWKINPSLDAAKIRCLKKEPIYKKAKKWLTTLEVMNRFLTGNSVIDPTNAASRQLYNLEKNDWDEKLLKAAHIDRTELPEILPTGEKVGDLCKEAAEQMGVSAGIPVFNGAHDQYCASIGAGAVSAGDMLLSAGTTWVLMGIGTKPLFTKSYIAPGKHPVEGLYGAMASLICSGASLQWFKNEFLPEDFEEINEVASKRRDKIKDVFFYPYLAGAGYPIWNIKAKGAFVGLTLEHDRYDFARAIMEGVAFGVKRGIRDFAENGCDIKQIIMMGGASKSSLWCQMIASITQVPIIKLKQADGCAMGAAMIAAHSLGIYKSYSEAAKEMVNHACTYEPLAEEIKFYEEKFQRFDKIWKLIEKYYSK